MFKLGQKQKIYRIGNLQVGGQPGELPIVLIGNIFYKGMPEVSNHKKGIFKKEQVRQWIERAGNAAEKSGVPHVLDIMAMYPEAIVQYITFISEQDATPFLIDGANPETRTAALELVGELGLERQAVFNGITPKTSKKELSAIKESGVTAAVIMAFNDLDYSPEGRIKILKTSKDQPGLLKMATQAGITEILVDTIVFDVPSISYAAKAIKLIKTEVGLPAGCSPANATYAWKQALKDPIFNKSFASCNTSAHTVAQCWGADFLIYGPIKQAPNIVPACALTDAVITYYNMRRFGVKPLNKDNPLLRML